MKRKLLAAAISCSIVAFTYNAGKYTGYQVGFYQGVEAGALTSFHHEFKTQRLLEYSDLERKAAFLHNVSGASAYTGYWKSVIDK